MNELNSEEIDTLMKLIDKIKTELSITEEGEIVIPKDYSLTLNEEQIKVLYKFFNEVKFAVDKLPEFQQKLREHFERKWECLDTRIIPKGKEISFTGVKIENDGKAKLIKH